MSTLQIFDGSGRTLKAVGKHQCNLLEFAEKYRGWHTYARSRTTQRAIDGLERRGCIEVKGDQFRFKEWQPK